jgi:hypothetical protein
MSRSRLALTAALAATASLALAALLLASGCGAADDRGAGEPDAGLSGDIELVAGNAAADGAGFVAKADGDDADLISGAQGGFHVWISIRLHGAAGTYYAVHEARRVTDDVLVLRGNRIVLDIPAQSGDDWWESPSASPAFLCPSPLGIQVFDVPIRFSVELRDVDDTPLARDDLVLVPRCPSGDLGDFCHQICSG